MILFEVGELLDERLDFERLDLASLAAFSSLLNRLVLDDDDFEDEFDDARIGEFPISAAEGWFSFSLPSSSSSEFE